MNKNFLTFLSASTFLIATNAYAGKTPGEWGDAVNGATLARLSLEKESAQDHEEWTNTMNQRLHNRAQSSELLHRQLRTFFANASFDDDSYKELAREVVGFWKTKATKARDAQQRFEVTGGTGKIETLEENLMKSELQMGRYIALIRQVEELEAQLNTPASAEEKGKEKEKEFEGSADITQKLHHAKEDLQRYAFLKFLAYANQFAAIPSSPSVNYHGFESYPETLPDEYFPVIRDLGNTYAGIYGADTAKAALEQGFLEGSSQMKSQAHSNVNERLIRDVNFYKEDYIKIKFDTQSKPESKESVSAKAAVSDNFLRITLAVMSKTEVKFEPSCERYKVGIPAAMTDEYISETLNTIPTPANVIKTKMIKWAQRVTDESWDAKFPVQSLIALAQDETMIPHLLHALSIKDLKASLPQGGMTQSKFQEALKKDQEKKIHAKPEGSFESKLASANEAEKSKILEKALLKMVSYANLSYCENINFNQTEIENELKNASRDPLKAGKALKWADRLEKHGQELIKKLGLKTHILYGFVNEKK